MSTWSEIVSTKLFLRVNRSSSVEDQYDYTSNLMLILYTFQNYKQGWSKWRTALNGYKHSRGQLFTSTTIYKITLNLQQQHLEKTNQSIAPVESSEQQKQVKTETVNTILQIFHINAM